MVYAGVSFVCGLTLPQLEHAYFPTYSTGWSAASAQAFFSAVASGMIALTGIVFSIAFVMVQFSATAYSPRLVLLFARDPKLFHALGVFIATFLYALAALTWVDRGATGVVPFFSVWVIVGLILASMLLFSQLIKRLSDLQISSVLRIIGDIGREVIRDTRDRPDRGSKHEAGSAQIPAGEATQSLAYSGNPRIVAKLDIDDLVRQARQ